MDAFRTSAEFSALTSLRITRGSFAGIHDSRGLLVRVEQGNVWITQAGETMDVCLEAGESFRIDRDGLTLISACGRAPFTLVTFDPPVPVAPTAGQRAADLFRKLWRGLYASRSRPITAAL